MKGFYLMMLLYVIGISACSKKEDTQAAVSYHIEGIKDVSMVKGTQAYNNIPTLDLTIVYDRSDRERVDLSLENVPAGLCCKLSPSFGTPSFTSAISFVDSGVSEGYYNIRLVAQGAQTGRREFGFNVTVTGSPECTGDVTGKHFVTNSSCSPSTNYFQDVTVASGFKNRVVFSSMDNYGAQVYGNIDCATQQIEIPKQTSKGIIYQGTGGYANTKEQRILNLDLQLTDSSGSVTNCTYKLVKQ